MNVEALRKQASKAAADLYAPHPNGSRFTYGWIGVGLTWLALMAFGGFYGLNPDGYPGLLLGLAGPAFVGGILLHHRRARRHRVAIQVEYEGRP